MFPSPDTSARATPSLQWVPWPPLAGALRFPTFIGTMGFYDRSRSIRHPSGRPLGSRTSPNEEEIGSSLRFLGHPCGACPGLETPASRPDLANSGRCRILPSANLDNVGLATMDNFGADPSRPAALLSTLRTHRSPGEWQDSLLTCLLDFSQVGLAPSVLDEFDHPLHPEKTRLIEFGRYAAERRKKRGKGKPETFTVDARCPEQRDILSVLLCAHGPARLARFSDFVFGP